MDGATLYTQITLNKTFEQNSMIALFTPIRAYNLEPVVYSVEKISGNKVAVIIRAITNTGMTFSEGTTWYGNLLVIGIEV